MIQDWTEEKYRIYQNKLNRELFGPKQYSNDVERRMELAASIIVTGDNKMITLKDMV